MRHAGEVVELTCTCELGSAGERAVVLKVDRDGTMTLVFANRAPGYRVVATGADYKFMREAREARYVTGRI